MESTLARFRSGRSGGQLDFDILLLEKYRASLALPGSLLRGSTRFGNILMHVSAGLPLIALGFILANLLIWCIPPARSALANEAEGFPGSLLKCRAN